MLIDFISGLSKHGIVLWSCHVGDGPQQSEQSLNQGCLQSLHSVEPPHDKTNKVAVRPAKTQISLGICPVWSESLLSAQWVAKDPEFLHADSEDSQWVAKDPEFLHADSEDSDQTGRMPRLIWVFAGRTLILLVYHEPAQFIPVLKN